MPCCLKWTNAIIENQKNMARSCIEIPNRETIQAVVFSIFFGIFLPSFDVGSDIRVALRLYLNGHPRWALSVLTPVLINTLFSAIACREMEERKHGASWIKFLPLVLLQCYPQFCTIRILLQFLRGELDLKTFTALRDGMDGGVGCLEPYCESVLQVFVQTALFSHVHDINPLITKLCLNTRQGIGDDCKENLTMFITGLDDKTIYANLNNQTMFYNSSLTQQYNATQDDLKVFQMNKLVIGDYQLFVSTYVISIFAACYGITKFFRLSHARMSTGIISKQFVYVSFVSATFFGMKGIALAGVVMGHESSLSKGIGYWLLFTKLPTTIMVIIFTVIVPFIRLKTKYPDMHFGIVAQMILKQPCLILSPLITPFFFTLNTDSEKLIDHIPPKVINGKMFKTMSASTGYSMSFRLSIASSIMSVLLSLALFLWKSKFGSSTLVLYLGICAIFTIWVYVWGYTVFGRSYDGNLACVEHDVMECTDCMRNYAFFAEGVKLINACDDHEKAPYQYQTDLRNCRKCNIIARRLVIEYY